MKLSLMKYISFWSVLMTIIIVLRGQGTEPKCNSRQKVGSSERFQPSMRLFSVDSV